MPSFYPEEGFPKESPFYITDKQQEAYSEALEAFKNQRVPQAQAIPIQRVKDTIQMALDALSSDEPFNAAERLYEALDMLK